MQFACEIVPSNYLTPLRRILARELANQKYTQVEIARILAVSQPVVSSYLKSVDPGATMITSRPAFKMLVSELLMRIKSDISSPLDMMETICKKCQEFRIAGPLCDIHRKETSLDFPPDCNICFPSTEETTVFGKKLQVTKELFEAAQQLINLEDKFGSLIPEIGCQFVYSVENSTLPEDIASFPGRIIRVKGKGRIISPPEFGQSSTLALILSYFQQQGSQNRSIISLKRTPTNLKLLTQEKYVVYTEEADKNWENVLKSFTKEEIKQIEVIADLGGVGFEPHLYLLGTTPLEITKYIISRLQ